MNKKELTPLAKKVSDIANSGCTAREGHKAIDALKPALEELKDKYVNNELVFIGMATNRATFKDKCAYLSKCVHDAELNLMNTKEQGEAMDVQHQGQHLAYIRVSSAEQNTERQLADTGIKFNKVYEDKCSGGTKDRPALERLKEHAREHDTIHVHSIDRLARNLEDLRDLVNGWTQQGITVRFHKEGLEFTSAATNPMSELLLNMLGAVAQFERSMIKERQREGIAKAKANGVYKGRKKTVKEDAIMEELKAGTSMRKTAEKLKYSLSTVQRTAKKYGWSKSAEAQPAS